MVDGWTVIVTTLVVREILAMLFVVWRFKSTMDTEPLPPGVAEGPIQMRFHSDMSIGPRTDRNRP